MTASQKAAADPETSAFVSANAGSGKTSTLVDRVARLLLRGVGPQAILCVTYTKAAAAEMQARLFRKLGDWAVMPDDALQSELSKLGETRAADGDLGEARKLFAKALETPGGLKIQTLHAFCEALLRRFPLEAGVAPGFEVLDDVQAGAVSTRARERLAELALARPDHPLAEAYAHFAVELDLGGFETLLKTFEIERRAIAAYVAACGGWDGAVADVWARCGFAAATSVEAVRPEALAECDWDGWRAAADALALGGKQDQKVAADLFAAIACAEDHPERFERCWAPFSRADGESKAERSLFTQATPPRIQDWLKQEQTRLQGAVVRLRAATVATDTIHALTLGVAYGELYEGEKGRLGALDFPDLIARAHALLTRSNAAQWVLYKLDGGIDHVLLDEAQDTAPEQWDILEALTGEFFSGAGSPKDRSLDRTVFAVGDEKQSIYSFQGARPERLLFETQRYEARARNAGRAFDGPKLLESWRSTPEVLSFVDAVFADPTARTALAPWSEEVVRHEPIRPAGFGSVELWPLTVDAPHDPPDAWDPVDAPAPENARKALARAVAEEVKRLVREDAVVDKETRTLRSATPGDVLILVRKRDAVFEEVIRALKQCGVPVAGADKLRLSDHIVFQDLLALIRVCLFTSDDLRLAAILRSPLCSLDEDSLFDLANGREGTLWSTLRRRAEERPEWAAASRFLGWARTEAKGATPFGFLGRVLSYVDGEGRSQRQRILTRLGREAEDVLDELLNEALNAEARGTYDLERFAAALEQNEVEVKRELEAAGGEVRVMTVHGAKGLEDGVVILPECAADPPKPRGPLLRTETGGFLYAPRASGDCPASAEARAYEVRRQAEEGLRLLYVALTRARDRIIVAGRLPGNRSVENGPDPSSWYARVEAAFARPEIADHARWIGDVRRFGVDPHPSEGRALAASASTLTAWLRERPAPEPPSARYAAPSTLAETMRGPAPSPLGRIGGLGRYRRGELIHKLFEVLPDLPEHDRPAAASRMLAREVDLTPDQHADIAGVTLAVLADPRFAAVFGPGSTPEAAVAGGAPDLPPDLRISGRLDRLVVTPDRVLVVDFKTNRPPPDRIEDADEAYIVQMAVYVAVLRALYPDRRVEAALLWTDGPKLMQVPENLVDLTLARLRMER
jgi:ATP-dependent helicase/nuclease subunit A